MSGNGQDEARLAGRAALAFSLVTGRGRLYGGGDEAVEMNRKTGELQAGGDHLTAVG